MIWWSVAITFCLLTLGVLLLISIAWKSRSSASLSIVAAFVPSLFASSRKKLSSSLSFGLIIIFSISNKNYMNWIHKVTQKLWKWENVGIWEFIRCAHEIALLLPSVPAKKRDKLWDRFAKFDKLRIWRWGNAIDAIMRSCEDMRIWRVIFDHYL